MIPTIKNPSNQVKERESTQFNDSFTLKSIERKGESRERDRESREKEGKVTRINMVDTINDTQSFDSLKESKLLDESQTKSRLTMATSDNQDLIEVLSSLSALKSTAL